MSLDRAELFAMTSGGDMPAPGMHVQVASSPGQTPRCTEYGCPVRYKGGPDRACRMHDDAAMFTPDSYMHD